MAASPPPRALDIRLRPAGGDGWILSIAGELAILTSIARDMPAIERDARRSASRFEELCRTSAALRDDSERLRRETSALRSERKRPA